MKLKYFELARRVSLKSDHARCKLGAVIVKGNRIISVGFNRMKTHPKSPNLFKCLHAEVDATLGIPLEDLDASEIYVYRARLDGSLGLAKPCDTCQNFLFSHGIHTAHFTTYCGYDTMRL